MATYFLADVHLAENRPEITTAFLTTLAAIARDADAIYLLGDLYDYWLGDDLATPYQQRIAAALAALPCPLYYQHGNRDFLLGARYAQSARLHLLPERHTLTLGDRTVLLEHGDLLCTDDRGYQRLRRILRCPPLQWLYYRLPRALRLRIAEKLRAQSKTRTRRKAARITNTNPAAIRAALHSAHASILIHGHTHRPAVHRLDNGDTVYVLGDWRPHGEILRYADGDFALVNSADIIHAPDNAGA
ncbi:UDP-2,3-diacylglucosamine diphosphatase [Cardiobacterium hominis]|uniref:UDP-2,3-diacylglucosamine diphosphatase n=1 Tax=Cardiobacterium hominis TaxID=2718 RepID=UPI0028D5202F|nr:UDP-2,3-diacylglucosamine diphosphatase [Cardiobacterium hominis]